MLITINILGRGGPYMTFLEIEAFLKITETGSFSAAAEALYVTQPAKLPPKVNTRGNFMCIATIKHCRC